MMRGSFRTTLESGEKVIVEFEAHKGSPKFNRYGRGCPPYEGPSAYIEVFSNKGKEVTHLLTEEELEELEEKALRIAEERPEKRKDSI